MVMQLIESKQIEKNIVFHLLCLLSLISAIHTQDHLIEACINTLAYIESGTNLFHYGFSFLFYRISAIFYAYVLAFEMNSWIRVLGAM